MKSETERDEMSCEILDSITILNRERRKFASGVMADGTFVMCGNSYSFGVLAFPSHAECESYEYHRSRLSKFTVRDSDKKIVFNFDRGMDVEPVNEDVAFAVDLLAGGLADLAVPM